VVPPELLLLELELEALPPELLELELELEL